MNKPSKAEQSIKKEYKSCPGTIYHYTSLNALINILQSKKLWLSSADSMNDEKEIKYFTSSLKERAKKEGEKDLIFMIDHRPIVSPFMCCFSKEPDLLSQWRAYGDDGYGVSIGFDTNFLKTHDTHFFNPPMYFQGDFFIQPVDYSDDYIFDFISNFQDFKSKTQMDEASASYLHRLIDYYSCLSKSSYFQEENETRLVVIPFKASVQNYKNPIVIKELLNQLSCTGPKFRVVNRKTIPYLEYSLEIPGQNKHNRKTPLCDIILGPKCNMSIEDVRFLLDHSYFDQEDHRHEIKISKSKGSYRE